MPTLVAFLDASVLYPAPVRDLLLELAVSDLYRAQWSNAVHDEWIEALLRARSDLTRERLERTRALMNAHVRDALITGFDDLIEILTLPDPDDRHVLAAVKTVRLRLRHPPIPPAAYIATLRAHGLPATADALTPSAGAI